LQPIGIRVEGFPALEDLQVSEQVAEEEGEQQDARGSSDELSAN
jgi:hypothetical protein